MRLVLTHSMPGRTALTNFEFDPNCDHRYCCICGAVFQSYLDRAELRNEKAEFEARMLRQEWADKHSRTHTEKEHKALRESGLHMTAEAAERLVPYGIIPLSDIVFNEESRHAGLLAKRAPNNDAEC